MIKNIRLIYMSENSIENIIDQITNLKSLATELTDNKYSNFIKSISNDIQNRVRSLKSVSVNIQNLNDQLEEQLERFPDLDKLTSKLGNNTELINNLKEFKSVLDNSQRNVNNELQSLTREISNLEDLTGSMEGPEVPVLSSSETQDNEEPTVSETPSSTLPSISTTPAPRPFVPFNLPTGPLPSTLQRPPSSMTSRLGPSPSTLPTGPLPSTLQRPPSYMTSRLGPSPSTLPTPPSSMTSEQSTEQESTQESTPKTTQSEDIQTEGGSKSKKNTKKGGYIYGKKATIKKSKKSKVSKKSNKKTTKKVKKYK
uniref:Uncharacterized protein n=1 Tax=viral metagenome TaxID=1070528 RepID=A0A6C0KH66_9ZZZZ